MSYSNEHRRMKPVLDLARRLDIAVNPEPEAIFEAGTAGFQIWCTPADHPKGWDSVVMTAGAFSKPCEYVASVSWGWEGENITHLLLSTDAYALGRSKRNHNRPADLAWAKRKIRRLFKQVGVTCPEIRSKE
ncbi:MAG: hypothetical protein AB1894_07435 [Chloroflexota bacterium]